MAHKIKSIGLHKVVGVDVLSDLERTVDSGDSLKSVYRYGGGYHTQAKVKEIDD